MSAPRRRDPREGGEEDRARAPRAEGRIDELEARMRAHDAFLRRLARRLMTDGTGADDVVQETWLRYLRYGATSQYPSRTWLEKVLHRQIVQRLRYEGRRPHGELDPASACIGMAAYPHAEHTEESLAVHRALDYMDDRYRTTLYLYFGKSLSEAMVAERLSIPRETVRTRIRRGLAQLREGVIHAR